MVQPEDTCLSVSRSLIRLGHLDFADFNFMPLPELKRLSALPDADKLLSQALTNSPLLLYRFREVRPDLAPSGCQPTEAATARSRLTRMWYE